MSDLSDLQVVLPYRDVVALLEASRKVDGLQAQIVALRTEQAALRGQFLDVMERFRELKDYVID